MSPKGAADSNDDYYTLTDNLENSLLNGDIRAAVTAATKLQSEIKDFIAKNQAVPLRYSNLYNINDALGRAAFLRQDYLSACDYFMQASAVGGGSPAMTTFGPDLWLAQALLNAGYRDVVGAFLIQCKTFWNKDTLTQYIETLDRGGTPDFAKNIFLNQPIPSR